MLKMNGGINTIIEAIKMSEDRKKVAELFKDEKFRAFSIFFFEKPRSITEVGKLSKVSRTTIYKYVKKLREFLETKSSPFQREKLYYLDVQILCEFYAEHLNLTKEGKEILFKILSDPGVESYLRINNNSWDDVFSKIVSLFISYEVLKFYITLLGKEKIEKALPIFEKLFLEIGMDRYGVKATLSFVSIATTVDKNTLEYLSQKILQDKKLALITNYHLSLLLGSSGKYIASIWINKRTRKIIKELSKIILQK